MRGIQKKMKEEEEEEEEKALVVCGLRVGRFGSAAGVDFDGLWEVALEVLGVDEHLLDALAHGSEANLITTSFSTCSLSD